MTYTPRFAHILWIVAVLCFLLAFFGVHPGGHELVSLGLAFGFLGFLLP